MIARVPPRGEPPPSSRRGAPVERSELVGGVIGDKYGIQGILGEGGMGVVYEAEHLAMGRIVAIKVLHPENAQKREAVTRLQHEAKVTGNLGHPNICEIYDMGRLEDGSPYVVMERLRGETLAQMIKRDGKVEPGPVVEIAIQVLSALAAAHSSGIIHRDLKPENVFLAEKPGGLVVTKLLDFGISKAMMASEDDKDKMGLTQTGMVMGTPYYMAPEQARGDRTLDHRVDIWAVGVMMYEAMTGRRPFLAKNYNALLVKILTVWHRSLAEIDPTIPPALALAVDKALSKMPEDRYRNAMDMQDALKRFLPRQELSYPGSFALASVRPVESAPAKPPTFGLPELDLHEETADGVPWTAVKQYVPTVQRDAVQAAISAKKAADVAPPAQAPAPVGPARAPMPAMHSQTPAPPGVAAPRAAPAPAAGESTPAKPVPAPRPATAQGVQLRPQPGPPRNAPAPPPSPQGQPPQRAMPPAHPAHPAPAHPAPAHPAHPQSPAQQPSAHQTLPGPMQLVPPAHPAPAPPPPAHQSHSSPLQPTPAHQSHSSPLQPAPAHQSHSSPLQPAPAPAHQSHSSPLQPAPAPAQAPRAAARRAPVSDGGAGHRPGAAGRPPPFATPPRPAAPQGGSPVSPATPLPRRSPLAASIAPPVDPAMTPPAPSAQPPAPRAAPPGPAPGAPRPVMPAQVQLAPVAGQPQGPQFAPRAGPAARVANPARTTAPPPAEPPRQAARPAPLLDDDATISEDSSDGDDDSETLVLVRDKLPFPKKQA